jgi:hypothetical protein
MKQRSELRWTEQLVMMRKCFLPKKIRLRVCSGGTCATCDGNPEPSHICGKALVIYNRRLKNEKSVKVEPGS